MMRIGRYTVRVTLVALCLFLILVWMKEPQTGIRIATFLVGEKRSGTVRSSQYVASNVKDGIGQEYKGNNKNNNVQPGAINEEGVIIDLYKADVKHNEPVVVNKKEEFIPVVGPIVEDIKEGNNDKDGRNEEEFEEDGEDEDEEGDDEDEDEDKKDVDDDEEDDDGTDILVPGDTVIKQKELKETDEQIPKDKTSEKAIKNLNDKEKQQSYTPQPKTTIKPETKIKQGKKEDPNISKSQDNETLNSEKCEYLQKPNETVFGYERYVQVGDVYYYPSFIYFDTREKQHYVKFMAFAPEPTLNVKCIVQFSDGGAMEVGELWIEPSPQLTPPFCYWKASIINCPVSAGRTPTLAGLMLVNGTDTPTKWEKVKYFPKINETKTVGFSVCLKGLYEADEADVGRLMEWFEMYKLLGAEKMYLYGVYNSAPAITTLLAYYAKTGFIEMRQMGLHAPSLGPKHVRGTKKKKVPTATLR